jgi:hypothetical protein
LNGDGNGLCLRIQIIFGFQTLSGDFEIGVVKILTFYFKRGFEAILLVSNL